MTRIIIVVLPLVAAVSACQYPGCVEADRLARQCGGGGHCAELHQAQKQACDDIPAAQGSSEANGSGNAQARAVAGRQDRLVFDVFDTAEKMENLRSAENDRQLFGLLGSRDVRFQVPASLEGNIVEEAKGGGGDDDRTRR